MCREQSCAMPETTFVPPMIPTMTPAGNGPWTPRQSGSDLLKVFTFSSNFVFLQLEVRRRAPPPRGPNPPQVEPPYQRVDLGQPARFRCWVPGEPNAHLSWAPARGGSLPAGAVDRDGNLIFEAVARDHPGDYVCSSIDPETGEVLQSPFGRLELNERGSRLMESGKVRSEHSFSSEETACGAQRANGEGGIAEPDPLLGARRTARDAEVDGQGRKTVARGST